MKAKTKKLFLSLFAFAALSLAACSGASDTSSGTTPGSNTPPGSSSSNPSGDDDDPGDDDEGEDEGDEDEGDEDLITVGHAVQIGDKYHEFNEGSAGLEGQDGSWYLNTTVSIGDAVAFYNNGELLSVFSDGSSSANNISEAHPSSDPFTEVHIKEGGAVTIYLNHWNDGVYSIWITTPGFDDDAQFVDPYVYVRGSALTGDDTGWNITTEDNRLVEHENDKGAIENIALVVGDFKLAHSEWSTDGSGEWGYNYDHQDGHGDVSNINGGAAGNFSQGEGNNIHCDVPGNYNIYLTSNDYIFIEEYHAPAAAKSYAVKIGTGDPVSLTKDDEAPENFVAQYSALLDNVELGQAIAFTADSAPISATASGNGETIYNNSLDGVIRKTASNVHVYLKITESERYEYWIEGGGILPTLENGYYYVSASLNNFDLYSGVKMELKSGSTSEYVIERTLKQGEKFKVVYHGAEGNTWFGTEAHKYTDEHYVSAYGVGYLKDDNPAYDFPNFEVVLPGTYKIYFETAQNISGIWTNLESGVVEYVYTPAADPSHPIVGDLDVNSGIPQYESETALPLAVGDKIQLRYKGETVNIIPDMDTTDPFKVNTLIDGNGVATVQAGGAGVYSFYLKYGEGINGVKLYTTRVVESNVKAVIAGGAGVPMLDVSSAGVPEGFVAQYKLHTTVTSGDSLTFTVEDVEVPAAKYKVDADSNNNVKSDKTFKYTGEVDIYLKAKSDGEVEVWCSRPSPAGYGLIENALFDASAVVKAHCWGASGFLADVTINSGDTSIALPEGTTGFVVIRMAPGTTEVVWNGTNFWGQSSDLTPETGKYLVFDGYDGENHMAFHWEA